jgi:prephenate dehydrogenase
VVAVPVTAIRDVFAALATCDGSLVTDVASVKQPVLEAAARERLRFVGGHPMAGRELAGYAAASDSLFSGARWALCLDDGTDVGDALAVADLVLATGAGVVPTTAVEHDRAVAVVSHLPHVLAAALAGRVIDDTTRDLAFGLAAGSFRDGTRVARAPAAFWAGIVDENAAHLTEVVRDVQATLQQLAAALEAHDHGAVESFFARGVRGRVELETRTATATTLDLPGLGDPSDNRARDALLALGRRGGYLTHIERAGDPGHATTVRARVPGADTA